MIFIFVVSLIKLFLLIMACSAPENVVILDEETPRNVYLSACYKKSFAYHTVKNRMPIILTQTVDGLVRNKDEISHKYGSDGQEELKFVIGELSKLKYEVETNKPLRLINSTASDVELYNSYINELNDKNNGNITFFSTIFLLAECYMYRRIREAFELTNHLKNYDPFFKQKQTATEQSLPLMANLGNYLLKTINKSPDTAMKDDFINLLKLNLWGNKCDLSLSNGVVNVTNHQLSIVDELNAYILADDSEKIWETIIDNSTNSKIIDIVLDNTGYELFTDLGIADYLISMKFAEKIRFYVKTIPWFISDVMRNDFFWFLDLLKTQPDENLKTLADRWDDYMETEQWLIIENDFWTLPYDYSQMKIKNIQLYQQLGESKFVIFKGDLNYRKLFGEKNWEPTTSIEDGLQGFHPTKLATLRTVKADIVCGLKAGVAEMAKARNMKWMETGEFGLIQFCGKIAPIQ